ncbi:hypothetical protein ACHAW6_015456 [Cyclotella cf. meneghiniana]
MTSTSKIPSSHYYGEYHGHKIKHLQKIYPLLRENSEGLIWTAGDSSLDNKYWFRDRKPAVGAYAQVLEPPLSVCDVTYWLNYLSENNQSYKQISCTKYAAINTAVPPSKKSRIIIKVEATTLNERCLRLRPQDKFLRDNLSSNDVLIVSIGGNDIALAPTPCTIASVAGLLCLPLSCLENGKSFGAVPMNDCCCGCGPSLASCTCSCPPCLGYFRHLFGTRTQKYIEALTRKTKPAKILVCMIYYPDENNVPSWANASLGALGYNTNPAKIQLLIRKFFEEATSHIRISGTQVIPVPLFHSLDGTRSEDYVARVEPSASGGRKMAELLLDAIHNNAGDNNARPGAPTTSLIDRSA